jgi:ubiquinone/menaquinone biosynthesis C-methylase UbiE
VFAAVLCECVLSLTPDPGKVLGEFFRILDPGGYLILSDLYLRCGDITGSGYPQALDRTCCLAGATSKERTLERLAAAGFSLRSWEDHSQRLRALAARLVFAYGSLEAFWNDFCGQIRTDTIAESSAVSRPGYFLLVARKEEGNG